MYISPDASWISHRSLVCRIMGYWIFNRQRASIDFSFRHHHCRNGLSALREPFDWAHCSSINKNGTRTTIEYVDLDAGIS